MIGSRLFVHDEAKRHTLVWNQNLPRWILKVGFGTGECIPSFLRNLESLPMQDICLAYIEKSD